MLTKLETSLSEIIGLADNWDGRGSAAPIDQATETAAALTAVPLGTGGLQLELHAGGANIEIEIDHLGRVVGVAWSRPI